MSPVDLSRRPSLATVSTSIGTDVITQRHCKRATLSDSICTVKEIGLKTESCPRSLLHRPSMLDLIDDTTLTSLPLPPPLKPKSRSSSPTRTSMSNASTPNTSSLRNEISEVESSNLDDTQQYEEGDSQYEEGDTQDPIVLIEDYVDERVESVLENNTLKRKESLAKFKEKLWNVENDLKPLLEGSKTDEIVTADLKIGAGIFNDRINEKKRNRSISNETIMKHMTIESRSENLEQIFGEIPGASDLKHCDLCEKPLYEISSIIYACESDKENTLKFGDFSKKNHLHRTHLYHEFICWECTETYEDFFDELYQIELNAPSNITPPPKARDKDEFMTTKKKLWHMFQGIQEKYSQRQPTVQMTSNFNLNSKQLNSKPSFTAKLLNQIKNCKSA
ncbi:uncharacterized protein PRCAT00001011001 [Priceomyces carsonii]|uniref:uncharacterized protein n=1 Tax=Priceomyces carsonii TaxID=28549 RepID=UPI002ED909A8|nr:unnamed protein product [Priceomyces carsonii]